MYTRCYIRLWWNWVLRYDAWGWDCSRSYWVESESYYVCCSSAMLVLGNSFDLLLKLIHRSFSIDVWNKNRRSKGGRKDGREVGSFGRILVAISSYCSQSSSRLVEGNGMGKNINQSRTEERDQDHRCSKRQNERQPRMRSQLQRWSNPYINRTCDEKYCKHQGERMLQEPHTRNGICTYMHGTLLKKNHLRKHIL